MKNIRQPSKERWGAAHGGRQKRGGIDTTKKKKNNGRQ